MSDRRLIHVERITPRWLQGEPTDAARGARYLHGPLVVADAVVERAWQGTKARLPELCDASCLGPIGLTVRIGRGMAETEDAYRARLARFRETWRRAGHPYGIIEAILGYLSGFGSTVRVVSQGGRIWHSGSTTTGEPVFWQSTEAATWDWDGYQDWPRYWVVIHPGTAWTSEGTWGAGSWGDGGVWGSTATYEQIGAVRELVRQWQAAHAWAVWLCIIPATTYLRPPSEGASTLPVSTWWRWGDGDPRVPVRVAGVAYVDGGNAPLHNGEAD